MEPAELWASADELRTAATSARGADAPDAISTLGLRADGRVSREQTLVAIEGRSFDHHVCTDGSEAWFDAGHLVSA